MIDIIKDLIEDKLNEVHTILPACITNINYARGICSVKILPKRKLCSKVIEYPELIEVRLDFVKFGSWKLQFPRKVGDVVWIGFSEVTISDETSLERFSLNEPFIIGSCESGYEDNSDDIILSNNKTRIEIKAEGDIVITTGSNNMTINSNIIFKGDIIHFGNYKTTGKIEAEGDVQGKGISLEKHTHKYSPGSNLPSNTSSSQ